MERQSAVKNENIITAFDFLIKEYNCTLSYEFDHGNRYLFFNDDFKVTIFTWEQFDDLNINLIYNMVNYHIDPYLEEPEKMYVIKTKKKGIRGFFYNYDRDFWEVVSMILKNKLNQLGIMRKN